MSTIIILPDNHSYHNGQFYEIDEVWARKDAFEVYSLSARLITIVFRYRWFGYYDAEKFHLDHRYSIAKGFADNVPLPIISGRNNLALVPKSENLRKGTRCSVTLAELYAQYVENTKVSGLATYISGKDRFTLRRWTRIARDYANRKNCATLL